MPQLTTSPNIATRYTSHPGSNVGDYVASATVGRNRRVTAQTRSNQSLSSEANHRAAAKKLADKLRVDLAAGDVTDRGFSFTTKSVAE